MRRLLMLTGVIIAVILGIALAYPLLMANKPPAHYESMGVDVVFAYFGEPGFSSEITGLWRNYTDTNIYNGIRFDVHATTYFVVLNVTNYSDEPINVKNIHLIAGPHIEITAQGSINASDPILNKIDSLESTYSASLLSAKSSKLIYLSGIIGIHDSSYELLESPLFIFSSVEGQMSSTLYKGDVLKNINFDSIDGSYLFNNVLHDDQMFIFYQGKEVTIGAID